MESSLVIEKNASSIGRLTSSLAQYGSALVILSIIMIVVIVWVVKQDGFASPDGVIASKKSRQGVRSDSTFNKSMNLKDLENAVASINKQASTK
jgi:hypothetical protein